MLKIHILEEAHANIEVEPVFAPFAFRCIFVSAGSRRWTCPCCDGAAQLHVAGTGETGEELVGVVEVVLEHDMLQLCNGGLVNGTGGAVGRGEYP